MYYIVPTIFIPTNRVRRKGRTREKERSASSVAKGKAWKFMTENDV